MENTRSYLSRFGGLGLFIIALLIVGVLVWLTVQSANDEGADTAVNDNDAEQQENAFTDGNRDEEENADGIAGNQDDDAAVSDDEETDEPGVAGTDNQRGAEGNLPNTGPASTVLSFLGVVAFAWISLSYRQSQRELAQSQK